MSASLQLPQPAYTPFAARPPDIPENDPALLGLVKSLLKEKVILDHTRKKHKDSRLVNGFNGDIKNQHMLVPGVLVPGLVDSIKAPAELLEIWPGYKMHSVEWKEQNRKNPEQILIPQ